MEHVACLAKSIVLCKICLVNLQTGDLHIDKRIILKLFIENVV
jgi:hypothetical protein